MNELSVVLKARDFISRVGPDTVPVIIEEYLDHIGAVIRRMDDLKPEEPGWSFENKGKHYICTNATDSYERQRFTICHELAHIVMGIPSEHNSGPSWSYSRKSQNEILCDVFASELLLPYKLFQPLVDEMNISLNVVDELARHFEVSTMATGSRYATFSRIPCAFVLSEKGIVRYTSRSTPLREANAWVSPRMPLPTGSVAERLRSGAVSDGPEEIEADIWFNDWNRGGSLFEDARHLGRWDQTVALLWFEDDEMPPPQIDPQDREEQEFGLAELDGILPWPGKSRRR